METRTEQAIYAGYDCLILGNGHLKTWVTVSCGPRIIGLSFKGGENMLAELPNAVYETPSGKEYRFRGGHRLWHAPEHPERTYVPDDEEVRVSQIEGGASFQQPIENSTGIQKSIEILLLDEEPRISINHTLTNHGASTVELAPWAITQLRPGGFAILPQNTRDTGLLPNRRLTLWPYTDVNSPFISWGNQFVMVQAKMRSEKLKIGWANPAGWLAYWLDGTVFVKHTDYHSQSEYYDYGSSTECFCDPNCIELETLGPKAILEPGQSVSHREQWLLFSSVQADLDGPGIRGLIERIEDKIQSIELAA